MIYWLQFWYMHSPGRFYAACLHSIGSLDNTFAVRDTAKNLGKPLFQDYTYQGRIIGVFLRCSRIAIGVLCYLFLVVGYALAFGTWLLFPLLCIVSLIGSVAGNPINEIGGI